MNDTPRRNGPKPEQDKDLRENPGIGQSKGAFARGGDLDDAEGDNTVEGDVENDPGSQGQVPPTGGAAPTNSRVRPTLHS